MIGRTAFRQEMPSVVDWALDITKLTNRSTYRPCLSFPRGKLSAVEPGCPNKIPTLSASFQQNCHSHVSTTFQVSAVNVGFLSFFAGSAQHIYETK